jgi:hypothetical protein
MSICYPSIEVGRLLVGQIFEVLHLLAELFELPVGPRQA